MKKLIIHPEFWELFPDGQFNILILKGIDNAINPSEENYFQNLLNDGKKSAKKFVSNESFTSNPVIEEWRDAFKTFRTKKGARSSIEALLKRVSQDRDFSPINPLVDLYNYVSLTYGVPAGGEDLDKVAGDMHLGLAEGGESFRPLGEEKDSPAREEELIYYDDEGAVVRSFNWREAERTMLTEDTSYAMLIIESINEKQNARADDAINELKELVDDYYETESTIKVLNKDNPEAELSL